MAAAPQRTAGGSRDGHRGGGLNGAPPAGTQDPRADGDVRDPGAQADALRSLAGRLLRGLAAQVQQRVPPADLDERDPDYIRETLPRMWLLASLYFRGEVRGLGNIPDAGPVLLVGNHSGGNLTPDTTVFSLAFHAYFGVERPFHQLANTLVLSMPGLGFLRKYGAVGASPANAPKALRSGAAVLVGERSGLLGLALEEDVPIVPVVAIGGQEIAALARLLRLDVLAIDDLLGSIPLPSKIVVEALPPIRLRDELGEDPDVDEVHAHVKRLMQDTLDALSAERRFPVIG